MYRSANRLWCLGYLGNRTGLVLACSANTQHRMLEESHFVLSSTACDHMVEPPSYWSGCFSGAVLHFVPTKVQLVSSPHHLRKQQSSLFAATGRMQPLTDRLSGVDNYLVKMQIYSKLNLCFDRTNTNKCLVVQQQMSCTLGPFRQIFLTAVFNR